MFGNLLFASILSLFIAPAILVFLCGKLNIKSKNATYGYFLMMLFVVSIITTFLEGIVPFGYIVLPVLLLLYATKTHLQTTWEKAGMLTGGTVAVMVVIRWIALMM